MIIKSLYCDVCENLHSYPKGLENHRHSELEIGEVPMNIWTPLYDLPKEHSLQIDKNSRGVSKFSRYLPSDVEPVTSSECMTTTQAIECCGREVLIKNEGQNPTGSFKDRGMALLVGRSVYEDKNMVAIPSTGNAALSLSYYSRIAGIKPILFVPKDIPKGKIPDEKMNDVIICDDLVDSYEKFFEFCRNNPKVYNGFPASDIFYLQGLKTLAYEVYLDMGNTVPDWIFLPCGSGGNIVSQYQGFKDLVDMGFSKKIPRFVSVQIEGADPITVGHLKGSSNAVVLKDPVKSKAGAIASDTCFNYGKIMRILKATEGKAISVTDAEIEKSGTLSDYYEFSSRSVFAAFNKLKNDIKPDERVLLVGTARKRNIT